MTCVEQSTEHADNESAEEKTNIKENCGTLCHLNDDKREADVFFFEDKVVLDSSGLAVQNDYIATATKDCDEFFKVSENSLEHKENDDGSSLMKDNHDLILRFDAQKTAEVPLESASEFSHWDAHKHFMDELELPEVMDCDKESNCNAAVKDICIDEGVPVVDKILIENSNQNSAGNKNDNLGEDVRNENEMLYEDPSKIQDANASTAKDDIKSLASDCLISSLEGNVNQESAEDTYLEDLMKLFGPKCSETGKTANYLSEKQYLGYNPFLEEPSYSELQCQSSEEAISGNHAAVTADVELNENDPSASMIYSTKVDTGASTSDYNNSMAATSDSAPSTSDNSKAAMSDERAENISEQVLDSDAMLNHDEENSDKISAVPASEVQCRNIMNITENSCEDKALANLSNGSQDQFADGEASFSSVGPMSGLISYSGLIPHSGNISLRSDSSTTSARSFAFPVLQSEWNSSPVRMAKADRRHRKHRGWRQGLLCCRF